jgi:hypothetical protein
MEIKSTERGVSRVNFRWEREDKGYLESMKVSEMDLRIEDS